MKQGGRHWLAKRRVMAQGGRHWLAKRRVMAQGALAFAEGFTEMANPYDKGAFGWQRAWLLGYTMARDRQREAAATGNSGLV